VVVLRRHDEKRLGFAETLPERRNCLVICLFITSLMPSFGWVNHVKDKVVAVADLSNNAIRDIVAIVAFSGALEQLRA